MEYSTRVPIEAFLFSGHPQVFGQLGLLFGGQPENSQEKEKKAGNLAAACAKPVNFAKFFCLKSLFSQICSLEKMDDTRVLSEVMQDDSLTTYSSFMRKVRALNNLTRFHRDSFFHTAVLARKVRSKLVPAAREDVVVSKRLYLSTTPDVYLALFRLTKVDDK